MLSVQWTIRHEVMIFYCDINSLYTWTMKNPEVPISQFPLHLHHFFYAISTFSIMIGLKDRLLLAASHDNVIYKCLHLRLKREKQSSFLVACCSSKFLFVYCTVSQHFYAYVRGTHTNIYTNTLYVFIRVHMCVYI